MMGVIVDDRNAADRTFFFKTAFGSMESRQTTYNRSDRNLHLCAKSDRRKGILYIVLSRNGKRDLSESSYLLHEQENLHIPFHYKKYQKHRNHCQQTDQD